MFGSNPGSVVVRSARHGLLPFVAAFIAHNGEAKAQGGAELALNETVVLAEEGARPEPTSGDELPAVYTNVTQQPQVKQCEFDIVRSVFERQFILPTTGSDAWDSSQVVVRWGDMSAAVAGATGNVAILFHYGVEGQSLRLGFNVVQLVDPHQEHGETVYDHDTVGTRFYPIAGGRASTTGSLQQWRAQYAEAYMERVRVLRHSGSTQALELLRGADTECYLLPWTDELATLGEHNSVSADDMLVLSSISGPDQRAGDYESGYRHHLAAHILKGSTHQLNNEVDPERPFHMKAAEMGTPCPPRCKKSVQPDPGPAFVCP